VAAVAAIVTLEGLVAAALVFPPLTPLLVFMGLALGALVLARLPVLAVVGAAVLGASFLPASLVTLPVGPLEIRGHELLIGGLVVLALVAPRRRWGIDAPGRWLAAFLVVLTITTVLAVTAGRVDIADAWGWGRVFVPALLVLALPRLFSERRAMERVLEGGVAVGAVTGAVALLFLLFPQVATLVPQGTENIDSGGIYGQEGQRIRLPETLSYALLWYAAIRLMEARPSRRGLWALAVALMVTNLALSLYRNTWVGVFVGLGVLIAFGSVRLRRRLVVGGVALALAASGILLAIATQGVVPRGLDTIVDRSSTLLDPKAVLQEDSLQDRAKESSQALEVISGSPVTGVGVGAQFGVFFNERRGSQYVRSRQFFLHNQYLYMLLVAGVPGLLTFLGFLVATGRVAWRARADPHVAALGAGLVMVAVSGVVVITVASAPAALALALVAAGIVVLARSPAETTEQPPG